MTPKKLAETQAPIHASIGGRWSPRAFSESPVERDKLLSLFEAARWAPSSSNEQPWAFIVTTRDDPRKYEGMAGVLVESNRAWASRAPVLILALAHTQFEKDGRANLYALYDLGHAAANISLQATELGLAVHQMAGFDVEAARQRFDVPPGWEPVSVIALGYAGDPSSLPEKLRHRETAQRTRKALDTFVFSGTWGQPALLASAAKKGFSESK